MSYDVTKVLARFTPDNTEGYTADELAELNRRFEVRCMLDPDHGGVDPDRTLMAQLDQIAECIMAEYDNEMGETSEEREIKRQLAKERSQATANWIETLPTAAEMQDDYDAELGAAKGGRK